MHLSQYPCGSLGAVLEMKNVLCAAECGLNPTDQRIVCYKDRQVLGIQLDWCLVDVFKHKKN